MTKEKSDEELMLAYRDGDEFAFMTLYQRYSGKVMAYLSKRLDKREERDEVFQQVFTKLHRARYTYDSQHRFVQWLFVITKTVLIDHWETASRKVGQPSEVPLEELEIPDLRSETYSKESIDGEPELLRRAELSLEQKQVIQWRVLDEMSYGEMASRLSRSEASVRQLVSRAIRKIRLTARKSTQGSGI